MREYIKKIFNEFICRKCKSNNLGTLQIVGRDGFYQEYYACEDCGHESEKYKNEILMQFTMDELGIGSEV